MKAVRPIVTCLMLAAISAVTVLAHPMSYKGTVVSVSASSLQVHAMDDMTKKESTMTFKVTDKTKVLRGEAVVKFADAKIQKDERIVVTVNTDTAADVALEIRLAPAK